MLTRLLSLTAVALVLATASIAHAADAKKAGPDLSVDDIIKKALDKGSLGFKQGTATLRMTITTAKGEARERTLDIKAMRGADGLLRSMVRFSKPADVNGTAYLVLEKKDALPDQYVYVPAAKTVRRVAAGNATSSFFGSDFTYADLMPLPMSSKEQVGIKKLDNADYGGQPVYVLEITPKVQGSPYGKILAYVHREFLVPVKLEIFDPDMKPLKTLKVKKLKKIENQQVPTEIEMVSEAGSKTEIVIENAEPAAKLTDADFTEEAMQR